MGGPDSDGNHCECYLTEIKWNFCCLFFVGIGLPIFVILTLFVVCFVYQLLLQDCWETALETTGLRNSMGPRLRDLASWPPLAADESSQNLGPVESQSSV